MGNLNRRFLKNSSVQFALDNMNRMQNIDYSSTIQNAVDNMNRMQDIDYSSIIQNAVDNMNRLQNIDYSSAIQNAVDSMNRMQNIDYSSAIQNAVDSMNRIQNIDFSSAIQNAVDNMNRIDFSKFISVVQHSINNMPHNDSGNINKAIISSIKDINSANIATKLNRIIEFACSEISEALDEYKHRNEETYKSDHTDIGAEITVIDKTNLSPEEYERIASIVDERLKIANKDKLGLKAFLIGLLISYGQDAIKFVVETIILPLAFISVGYVYDNHVQVINTIQESLSTEISTVGYTEAKSIIKTEGINKYEYLNLIGITRVDSFIRTSPNKQSAPTYSKKIPLNTVVTLVINEKQCMIRKKNWIKVEIIIEGNIIEGWIEESKVIRFKRQR